MLDNRTAVAENDELMRAVAKLLVVWREIYVSGSTGEKLVAEFFIHGIDKLAFVMEWIDPDWEAHYVGNTGQIAGLFLVIAAWGFAVGSRDAEELAVVMPLTAFMVLMGVSLLLLA